VYIRTPSVLTSEAIGQFSSSSSSSRTSAYSSEHDHGHTLNTAISASPQIPQTGLQAMSSVDPVEARRLIDREGYLVLDVRSVKSYDGSHITKPPQVTMNAPFDVNTLSFKCTKQQLPPKGTKLLVMCENGGEVSQLAMLNLVSVGYPNCLQVQGGYHGWTNVWSPSGKRRPPPGRWVSTGTEALKSGLNIPGVAESYDEGGNLTKARYVPVDKDGRGSFC
jgi:rhodanese-related sulfurtransferase